MEQYLIHAPMKIFIDKNPHFYVLMRYALYVASLYVHAIYEDKKKD